MPHPILLAIETSQRTGGVAVSDLQGRAHAEPLSQSLRHDDELLPAIDRLYTRLGLEPRQTRAVGVSIGPGGFTGLRIAVATAKMLAETLGVDLVAVPSALVAAGSYRGSGPIVVALAAKGETCWATRLRRVRRRRRGRRHVALNGAQGRLRPSTRAHKFTGFRARSNIRAPQAWS